MTIELGPFGVWKRAGDTTPDLVAGVEEMGYGAFWVGGSPAGDLRVVEEVLDATDHITVATGIVNMWREDADTVARSYQRIAEKHPGRFLLGVGIGHPEATSEYQTPLAKIRDYLDRLGEMGVPEDGQVLAALGPEALRIAAERTAGAHPYLTTHRHTRFARETVGEGTLLAPEHMVIIDGDEEGARERARATVSRYLRLTNYRNNLLREGWGEDDLEDGGSDRLVDELVLHGDVEEVAAGLRLHLGAGGDHVSVQALGSEPMAELSALAETLL